MSKYRKNNFIASDNREGSCIWLHPLLIEGIKAVAKREKKSISWVAEEALSDYFGVRILLKKLKGKPKPAYDRQLKLIHKKRA